MTPKNEEILEKKFQEVFDNHFDEIPYYKDMNFETEIDVSDIANKISKRNKSPSRRLKIASFFIAIFIVSSLFTIVLTNGSVEAGKDKVWNFINSLKGDDHKISDEAYSFEINDLNDQDSVNKAKDVFPNLLLMGSVLDGYTFDYMTVDKIDKNNIFTNAVYYKDEIMLLINQSLTEGEIGIQQPYKEIEIENGTLLLNKDIDEEVGTNSATYIRGNNTVEIIGLVGLNELEQFMRDKIIPNI